MCLGNWFWSGGGWVVFGGWWGVDWRGERAEERSSIVSDRSSVRSGRLVSGSMVARFGGMWRRAFMVGVIAWWG